MDVPPSAASRRLSGLEALASRSDHIPDLIQWKGEDALPSSQSARRPQGRGGQHHSGLSGDSQAP